MTAIAGWVAGRHCCFRLLFLLGRFGILRQEPFFKAKAGGGGILFGVPRVLLLLLFIFKF